jgi:hypothetical protein
MMCFHRSTSGKLSDLLPCYCPAQRIRKRGRPARRIAWEGENLPSAQLNQSIAPISRMDVSDGANPLLNAGEEAVLQDWREKG